MDVKLVNPFIDAFTTVLPQMGFPTPQRTGMTVNNQNAVSQGVAVIVGFTKEIRGNVVYNMSEDTAKFIASTMMMGMPVESFLCVLDSMSHWKNLSSLSSSLRGRCCF